MSTNNQTITNAAERIQRSQNLMAMERLTVNMGGRDAYIGWLSAMPEDVVLTTGGGMSQASALKIAEDEEQYTRLVKAFALAMLPKLKEAAEG